ncbi:MAG: SDR family oxidoreductase [Nitrospirae bacterium]|nr:SDR family oxidoreductase [Nitrospirota bacterium]
MRALVIGASGMVGGALMRALSQRGHEATGTYRNYPIEGYSLLDVNDGPSAERLILQTNPDWIFCPAGMTRADLCEEKPYEARRDIFEGPLNIGRLGKRFGAGFVFYSSSYVFDGQEGPYCEEDQPKPLNVYGQCKLAAELAIQAQLDRWLILRTIVVYGLEAQSKNFVCQVLRAAQSGTRMPVTIDQISNPIYSEDLASSSVELAEQNKIGLYHVAGAVSLDRFNFGQLVCEVFGYSPAFLDPLPTSQLLQLASRPLHSGLRIEKAQAELKTPLRGALAGLQAMKEEMLVKESVKRRGI